VTFWLRSPRQIGRRGAATRRRRRRIRPTRDDDGAGRSRLAAAFRDFFRFGFRALTSVGLVAHRFSTARVADRIVVVEGSRVVEDGSHRQLMAAGGTYAGLYAIQAESYR
jgi:hypothetical protein